MAAPTETRTPAGTEAEMLPPRVRMEAGRQGANNRLRERQPGREKRQDWLCVVRHSLPPYRWATRSPVQASLQARCPRPGLVPPASPNRSLEEGMAECTVVTRNRTASNLKLFHFMLDRTGLLMEATTAREWRRASCLTELFRPASLTGDEQNRAALRFARCLRKSRTRFAAFPVCYGCVASNRDSVIPS